MSFKLISAARCGVSLASLGLVIVLSGCSNNDQAQTPPTAPPSTTIVTTPAPPGPTTTVVAGTNPDGTPQTNNTNAGSGGATGNDIGQHVTDAIHTNAQMTGSRVTAVADPGGTIRLTGTAQNQQQKALAESTARQTSGVSSVVNKIEIVPTGGVHHVASKPTVIQKTTKVYVIQKPAPDAMPGSADSSANPGGADAAGTTPPADSTTDSTSSEPATPAAPATGQ